MNNYQLIVINIQKNELDSLISFYQHLKKDNPNPYVQFFASDANFTITIYKKEHQGTHKVVFQGTDATLEAHRWNPSIAIKTNQERLPLNEFYKKAHLGSDEVGTGDFLGPVIVVACFIDEGVYQNIKHLSIGDSKTKSDQLIKKIGPILIKKVKHSILIVPPRKYNELTKQSFNMNKIKAWLHQQALANLAKKYPADTLKVIDQFTPSATYQKYVKDLNIQLNNLHFVTKAESKYSAVAVSSLIARYVFLVEMEKLNTKYKLNFPFGSGAKVDKFCLKFIEKHGKSDFDLVSKHNFANYKRIINQPVSMIE